jgi:hypothetical protein
LLNDKHLFVQLAGANAISKLIERCKYQFYSLIESDLNLILAAFHDAITNAIPEIVQLLKDIDDDTVVRDIMQAIISQRMNFFFTCTMFTHIQYSPAIVLPGT